MEAALPAATVMFQTQARPDVSRRPTHWELDVLEIEKSATLMELNVSPVIHIPELKERTLSASQINAKKTKSSLG
jgi:hypothetical protein